MGGTTRVGLAFPKTAVDVPSEVRGDYDHKYHKGPFKPVPAEKLAERKAYQGKHENRKKEGKPPPHLIISTTFEIFVLGAYLEFGASDLVLASVRLVLADRLVASDGAAAAQLVAELGRLFVLLVGDRVRQPLVERLADLELGAEGLAQLHELLDEL